VDAAIRFEDIRKTYADGSVAVAGVTLGIATGAFVALVGASGSGKSTLLKTINRLVEPTAGRVLLGDQDVAGLPLPMLRRRIGYVFQHVGLFPHMDVAANIGIALRLAGQGRPGRVDELLDLMDLPRDFAGRMPAELSGGQAQRVGVARALAAGPAIMLMDEPFGALDPVTRDALGKSYRALHDRLGMTTIMVTHDMAEALLIADRVIVMEAGTVVADAPPAALLTGAGGPAAQALVAVPRDQARRLHALETVI
jgi:osmoprotectant transport system ATP-binding protein